MCGICFCIKGIKIEQHVCNFNIFERYAQNAYVEQNEELRNKYLNSKFDFINNVNKNNLFINDFSIEDIKQAIRPRGPNAFSYRQFLLDNTLKSSSDQSKLDSKFFEVKSKKSSYDIKDDSGELYSTQKKEEVEFKENLKQSKEQDEESKNQQENLELLFCNSLLHLRGDSDHLNIQPFVEKDKNSVFIYNGEIFVKTLDSKLKDNFNPFTNDTEQIYAMLNRLCEEEYLSQSNDKKSPSQPSLEEKITNVLADLQGDYSFVYYNQQIKKLFIGKDPFGKRSLLLGFTKNGFVFSSCSINVDESKLIQEADDEDGGDDGIEKGTEVIAEETTDKKLDEKISSEVKFQKDIRYNMKDPEQRLLFLEKKYLHDYFVAKEKEWIEVPQNTLIVIDMQDTQQFVWDAYLINKRLYNISYNWNEKTSPIMVAPEESINIVLNAVKQSVKDHVQNIIEYKNYFKTNVQDNIQQSPLFIRDDSDQPILYQQMQFEYNKKQTNSKVCVLFSGGLDSTLLTLFLDQLIPQNESIKPYFIFGWNLLIYYEPFLNRIKKN